MLHQVLQFYGDAEPFIREFTFSPATRQHLLQIFEDEDSAVQLRKELAATVDGGEPFVKKTYLTEVMLTYPIRSTTDCKKCSLQWAMHTILMWKLLKSRLLQRMSSDSKD